MEENLPADHDEIKVDDYIPALRYNFLTRAYDFILKASMKEDLFKRALVRQANVGVSHAVLDIGAGTGTLTMLIKTMNLEARVRGIDADSKILEIARKKAGSASIDVIFETGLSYKLPYSDESFDRVFSSLLFHHLTKDNKIRTLREVFRVLRPNGELHVADWGKASNSLIRAMFYMVQILDGFETTADNVNGLLPSMMAEAGFEVKETSNYDTLFGTIRLLSGKKSVNRK